MFISILSFIGTSGTTSMLLITDYHKIGSLYDFLKSCPITEEQMVSNSCLNLIYLNVFAQLLLPGNRLNFGIGCELYES